MLFVAWYIGQVYIGWFVAWYIAWKEREREIDSEWMCGHQERKEQEGRKAEREEEGKKAKRERRRQEESKEARKRRRKRRRKERKGGKKEEEEGKGGKEYQHLQSPLKFHNPTFSLKEKRQASSAALCQ